MQEFKNRNLTLPATALILLWAWSLFSRELLVNNLVTYGVFVSLYGATCFCLYKLNHEVLPLGVRIASALVAMVATFTLWGTLVGQIQMPLLPTDAPRALKSGTLFFIGPIASAIVGAILYFPIMRIAPKTFWTVPLGAAVLVISVQSGAVFDDATRLFTRLVMIWELVCLSVFVSVIMMAIHKFLRHQKLDVLARRSE